MDMCFFYSEFITHIGLNISELRTVAVNTRFRRYYATQTFRFLRNAQFMSKIMYHYIYPVWIFQDKCLSWNWYQIWPQYFRLTTTTYWYCSVKNNWFLKNSLLDEENDIICAVWYTYLNFLPLIHILLSFLFDKTKV